jgi:energy-coupling factor transporter ATP-binding protein EcfA2
VAFLEVRELTYTYPGCSIPALKNVSLQADAGDLIGLVGANGAGKSTLCYALAGFIPHMFSGQMDGFVQVAGLDTRAHSLGQMAGQVGLVLQNPANQLSGVRYTVYEEVAFGLENLGVPRAEMAQRIEQALNMVGISSLASRSPFTLSGGEQQRLALASILVMEPRILVLDEPTATLDPQGAVAFFQVLQRLRQMGTTVVLAENKLEWLGAYASHMIVLAQGEIILRGAPQNVLTSSRLLDCGVGWLRLTQAAQLGRERHLWPAEHTLPVTLEQAEAGFRDVSRQLRNER